MCFLGRTGSGKTTLLNAIMERHLLPQRSYGIWYMVMMPRRREFLEKVPSAALASYTGNECHVVCPHCGELAPLSETRQLKRLRKSCSAAQLSSSAGVSRGPSHLPSFVFLCSFLPPGVRLPAPPDRCTQQTHPRRVEPGQMVCGTASAGWGPCQPTEMS